MKEKEKRMKMGLKKFLSVIVAATLITTSIPPKAAEASFFTDLMGGFFTILTAPIWVFCPNNPTFRKNNPFRKKVWEEERDAFNNLNNSESRNDGDLSLRLASKTYTIAPPPGGTYHLLVAPTPTAAPTPTPPSWWAFEAPKQIMFWGLFTMTVVAIFKGNTIVAITSAVGTIAMVVIENFPYTPSKLAFSDSKPPQLPHTPTPTPVAVKTPAPAPTRTPPPVATAPRGCTYHMPVAPTRTPTPVATAPRGCTYHMPVAPTRTPTPVATAPRGCTYHMPVAPTRTPTPAATAAPTPTPPSWWAFEAPKQIMFWGLFTMTVVAIFKGNTIVAITSAVGTIAMVVIENFPYTPSKLAFSDSKPPQLPHINLTEFSKKIWNLLEFCKDFWVGVWKRCVAVAKED